MSGRLLHLKPAKGGKDFVGIRYIQNEIEFCYPETFRWNCDVLTALPADALDDDIASGIRLIMSSIEYAKTYSTEKTSQNDTSDGEEAFAMKSYIWMIQDFMKNGSYKNREPVFKTNQKGRINWKRTLSKMPIYSEGNFIYKDFVVSTKNQADNLLVEIHQFCVRKSVYLVGWLYGIRSSNVGVKRLADVELSKSMKNRYVYAIRYELDHTFDDEKRLRLNHMLNVVMGLNKSENGQLVYGVDSYDHVFECAVDRVLGTEKNQDKEFFYPHGEWSNGIKDSALRIDSLLKKDDTYVIIDSKCYRYAVDGYGKGDCAGLPATDSIQKQISYGDSVQKKTSARGETAKIYNCFILPYDKTANYGKKPATDEFLWHSGLHAITDWRNGKSEYEKVYVLFVDMRDLLEKNREYDHSKEQEKLNNLLL